MAEVFLSGTTSSSRDTHASCGDPAGGSKGILIIILCEIVVKLSLVIS